MIFQDFQLFPHLTAADNVAEAPRQVLGMDRAAARARAHELLDRVGLAAYADIVSAPAFRRPEAARRHRPGLGHAAARTLVRRDHKRAGSRAQARSARRARRSEARRHDALTGDARDRFRPPCRRSGAWCWPTGGSSKKARPNRSSTPARRSARGSSSARYWPERVSPPHV